MKRLLSATLMAAVLWATVNSLKAYTQEPQPPIAGGYSEASVTDKEVVAAAKFAVSRKRGKHGGRISLISIERAEQQVVAGMNYRLCLKVKQNGRRAEVLTVIYRDLQRKYSLSSWEKKNCRAGD